MAENPSVAQRIEYPRRLKYGFGKLVSNVWASLAFTGILVMAWVLVTDMTEPGDTLGPVPVTWLLVGGAVVVGLFWLGTVRSIVAGIALAARLPRRTDVEGIVVARHSERVVTSGRSRGPRHPNVFWVAIDTGTSSRAITASRIAPHHWRTVYEGDVVRATFAGLMDLKNPSFVARMRGKDRENASRRPYFTSSRTARHRGVPP